MTLIAALLGATRQIRLVSTMSTTFNPTFHIARHLSSIDHLSNGRVGWNIVTSRAGEENYGSELPTRGDRYAIADEFLDAATQLWDGWAANAIRNDRDAGIWADDTKIQATNFGGKYFSIKGPLNIPRSLQGRPALLQAGQSEEARVLGTRLADIVHTAQTDIRLARAFRKDMFERIMRNGRNPDRFRLLPGITSIFGDTLTEARSATCPIPALLSRNSSPAFAKL